MFKTVKAVVLALGILMPISAMALKLDLKEEINDVEILRHQLFATKRNVNQCQLDGENKKNCYCQNESDFDALQELYKNFYRKHPNLKSANTYKYKLNDKARYLSRTQYLKAIKFPYHCSTNAF